MIGQGGFVLVVQGVQCVVVVVVLRKVAQIRGFFFDVVVVLPRRRFLAFVFLVVFVASIAVVVVVASFKGKRRHCRELIYMNGALEVTTEVVYRFSGCCSNFCLH
jgi:hypothetical protein